MRHHGTRARSQYISLRNLHAIRRLLKFASNAWIWAGPYKGERFSVRIRDWVRLVICLWVGAWLVAPTAVFASVACQGVHIKTSLRLSGWTRRRRNGPSGCGAPVNICRGKVNAESAVAQTGGAGASRRVRTGQPPISAPTDSDVRSYVPEMAQSVSRSSVSRESVQASAELLKSLREKLWDTLEIPAPRPLPASLDPDIVEQLIFV